MEPDTCQHCASETHRLELSLRTPVGLVGVSYCTCHCGIYMGGGQPVGLGGVSYMPLWDLHGGGVSLWAWVSYMPRWDLHGGGVSLWAWVSYMPRWDLHGGGQPVGLGGVSLWAWVSYMLHAKGSEMS
uniref:Uncharacterized protein n=1 Tax=Knipowitschia caucasica TaxID=637954 RepID=A0AAV2LIX2_KNICA